MTLVTVTLNGESLNSAVPEAIVLDVRRPLVGKRRHEKVEIPGRAGSWIFDEEPGDRDLEIDIDIQAESFADRRAAVKALARWVDVGTTSQLLISDEPGIYYDAILENTESVERLLYGQSTLRFTVGPYAFATTASTQAATAGSNPDTDTFSITDEVTAEPVLELTPAGGTLLSFVLTVNGYELQWAGTRLAGETLTISSISDTVTLGENDDVNLVGAFDEADVDMSDVAGEFPLLFEGSNSWSISWTGTATSVALDFTWRERTR